MIKIGLDYHGVIDAAPDLFKTLSEVETISGNEIHIVTGRREELAIPLLEERNITYQQIFSISDYHYNLGTEMTGYFEDNPKMSNTFWTPTKGYYAEKTGLHVHIDDSDVYGRYFPSDCLYIKYREQTLAQLLNSITEVMVHVEGLRTEKV